MDKKYSLHKISFFYTDQYYMPFGLADSIGLFDTYEAAQQEQLRRDIMALRIMNSPDYLGELTGFYEYKNDDTHQKVAEYALSQNWDKYLTKKIYGDNSGFYWELALPDEASNEQLTQLLTLMDASFHKVVAYTNLKTDVYVKMEKQFWDKVVFQLLKARRVVEEKNLYMVEMDRGEYYLINQHAKDEKKTIFSSMNEANQAAVHMFLNFIQEFPENNFLGKTYVEDWSTGGYLFMRFLDTCESISLTTETISAENSREIARKLQKIQPLYPLKKGDEYFEVQLPAYKNAIIEEILGLIELLRVKPFEIFNHISEIDGQQILADNMDLITF